MAAGAKNLAVIMSLTEQGRLPPGAAVCDIGASELHGGDVGEACASFLAYYARRRGAAVPASRPELPRHDGGHPMLGDLLKAAGFGYTALDVAPVNGAIGFDLNMDEPGPELAGRFDLVLNFGTTEHLVNQYQAHKTIYDLLRVGGAAYHDLPFSGYAEHGYFKYNPLFFRHLAEANRCEIVLERLTAGRSLAPPAGMAGEAPSEWRDYGLELVMTRRDPGPFRIGLETSTSLAPARIVYGEVSGAPPASRWLGRGVEALRRRLGALRSRARPSLE